MDPFASDSEHNITPTVSPLDDDEDYSVLCDSTQPLGLDCNYVPDWKGGHAIREYHQNWKDGIKEAFRLKNRDILIIDRGFDSEGTYTIEARRREGQELLGFILWSNGAIQYSNFGAQLSRKALNLGSTTKRNDNSLSGVHGEGLKVASLVMVRKGYRVRYEASSYYWDFLFGGRDSDMLYCKLTAVAREELEGQIEEHSMSIRSGRPRQLKANIWEDVTVRIGRVQGKGEKVEQGEFLKWMKVSLDLDPPQQSINTRYGSLILDQRYKGRIYLKSLLLEGEPVMPFWFGYNFNRGEVNRDRQRLGSPKEEAMRLAQIWGDAIKLDEAIALPELLRLLQASSPWGDVHLAEDYMSFNTAKRIWAKLREKKGIFYYFEGNGDQDIEVISKSLRKQPSPLNKATWSSLRRFKLIKTPEEQRYHLLQKATPTSVPDTAYSRGVERALRSLLALDPRSQHLELHFRSRADAELDVLLQDSRLIINDKWLDVHASHQDSMCSLYLQSMAALVPIEQFTCGHVLRSLHDLILVELDKAIVMEPKDRRLYNSLIRQLASEGFDQMPCMVEIAPGVEQGVLEVSWFHARSVSAFEQHGLVLLGRVKLHRRSSCADKRSRLLMSSPLERQSLFGRGNALCNLDRADDCDCLEKLVELKARRVTFHGLSDAEEYFAIVSSNDMHAFLPPPPAAVLPKGTDDVSLDLFDNDAESSTGSDFMTPDSRGQVADSPTIDEHEFSQAAQAAPSVAEESELRETREALEALIEVLRGKEEQLEESRNETKRLQDLLSQASCTSNNPIREDSGLAADVSALQDQIREMMEQQGQLVSHLETAEGEVRKALDMIPQKGSGTKRKRIKEESGEYTRVVKRPRK